MDYGLINAFLALDELSEHDQMLKQNVLSLNQAFQKLTNERVEASHLLQKKEQDLLKVSGALENQLSIVEHLAKKMNLQPLKQIEEVEEETVEGIES
jgi:hypothetical protein